MFEYVFLRNKIEKLENNVATYGYKENSQIIKKYKHHNY